MVNNSGSRYVARAAFSTVLQQLHAIETSQSNGEYVVDRIQTLNQSRIVVSGPKIGSKVLEQPGSLRSTFALLAESHPALRSPDPTRYRGFPVESGTWELWNELHWDLAGFPSFLDSTGEALVYTSVERIGRRAEVGITDGGLLGIYSLPLDRTFDPGVGELIVVAFAQRDEKNMVFGAFPC